MFMNKLNVFIAVALATVGTSAAPVRPVVRWVPSNSWSSSNAAGTQSSEDTTIGTPNSIYHNDNSQEASAWDTSNGYNSPWSNSYNNAAGAQWANDDNTYYANTNGDSLSSSSQNSGYQYSSNSASNNNWKRWGWGPSNSQSSYDASGTQSSDSTSINTPGSHYDNSNYNQASSVDASQSSSNPWGGQYSDYSADQWANGDSTNYNDINGNSLHESSSSSGYAYSSDSGSYNNGGWKRGYWGPSGSQSSYDASGTQSSDSTSINTPGSHFDNSNYNQASSVDASQSQWGPWGGDSSNVSADQWAQGENTNYNDINGNSLHQSSSNSGYDYSSNSASYNNGGW